MPEVVNNECLVKCKSCDSIITANWSKGVFGVKKGWRIMGSGKKDECPKCHQKVKLKNVETVVCSHCGRLVEKTEDGICFGCHKKMATVESIGTIECPECGMNLSVPKGHAGAFTCPICSTVIPDKEVNSLLAKKNVYTEQYIKLPDVETMEKNHAAIWRHPQNEFPFKSRMQVNEGTYALFLQNGVCHIPYSPGHYLLQDSDLLVEEKLTASLEGEDKIFKMDVFCVLKDLPELSWGCQTNEFWNSERSARYQAGVSGKVSLQVVDAKAYVSYLTFKPVTITELTKANPQIGSEDDGILLQMVRSVMPEALYSCLNGKDGSLLETLVPDEIKNTLINEANQRIAPYGLQIKTLWINNLNLKRTGATVAADQIRQFIQSDSQWQVGSVRLHVPGDNSMYADVDFGGLFRLKILDEKTFMNSSEVKKLIESQQVSEFVVKDFYAKKVEMHLRNILSMLGQEQIDRGEIRDLLDSNQYVNVLRDRVKDRLNYELSLDGLSMANFVMNLPGQIKKSDAYANVLDQPARRQAVRQGAEAMLQLSSQTVPVHIKDNPSIYLNMLFGGKAVLRVQNEEGFYNLTEIKAFLNNNQPVLESAVRDHFTSRLTPIFQEIISRVVQGIVDQTNADIREMGRYTMLIKNSVQENLQRRVEQWGMRVESLDMDVPVRVGESANFDKMISKEQMVTGQKLDEDMQRMQNDHVLFIMGEDGRIKMHGKDVAGTVIKHETDVDTDVAIHTMTAGDKVAMQKLEIEKAQEIARLQKGAELDKLADEITFAKTERRDDALLEDYKRKYKLHEQQLNDKIREDALLQKARIDSEMEDQRAEIDQMLTAAKSQIALNDLMHQIDSSDLTWQQKLDEYDRLRRLTLARDDVDVMKMESDARIHIFKDQNEAWYQADTLKLKLSADQAQLMEQLARYDEDRQERRAAADAARTERKAILDFEQRMQDRREHVAQQIELLDQTYKQELEMHSKNIDLDKLKVELDSVKYQAGEDAKVKIAEAQAAVRIAENQMKREESILKQAEDFKKDLLDIQKVLEMTRLSNERNKDDKITEAVIGTANAFAGAFSTPAPAVNTPAIALDPRFEQLNDQLSKKINSLSNSVKSLKARINDLTQQIAVISTQVMSGAGAGSAPHSAATSNTVGSSGGGQAAPATKICSLCRTQVPAGMTTCPNCGNLIL